MVFERFLDLLPFTSSLRLLPPSRGAVPRGVGRAISDSPLYGMIWNVYTSIFIVNIRTYYIVLIVQYIIDIHTPILGWLNRVGYRICIRLR